MHLLPVSPGPSVLLRSFCRLRRQHWPFPARRLLFLQARQASVSPRPLQAPQVDPASLAPRVCMDKKYIHTDFSEFLPGATWQRVAGGEGEGEGDQGGGGGLSPSLTSLIKKESVGLPIPTATAPPNLPQRWCCASSLLPFPPAPRTPGTHHTLPRGTYGLESSAASHDKPKHSPDATAKPPRSAATANVSVAQCIAHRASTPESHWPQINPRGRYAGLQTPPCCSCAGPHAPGRRQSPFQRCLCRTRRRGSRGQRRVTYERTRVIKP